MTLSLPERAIEGGTTVRLVGIPMDQAIAVTIQVDGRPGPVTFGTQESGEFEVELST